MQVVDLAFRYAMFRTRNRHIYDSYQGVRNGKFFWIYAGVAGAVLILYSGRNILSPDRSFNDLIVLVIGLSVLALSVVLASGYRKLQQMLDVSIKEDENLQHGYVQGSQLAAQRAHEEKQQQNLSDMKHAAKMHELAIRSGDYREADFWKAKLITLQVAARG